MSKIKVFFDGSCNLCSREIKFYQKISPDNIFEWKDLFKMSEKDFKLENLKLEQCLKFLHVKDENDDLKAGVDAFITIWKKLKYWNILAKIISYPLIKQVTKFLYYIFATIRFSRLKKCKTS
jgi:predicted DCC family thiol-disulfide oxidoreductase YuxK